MDGPAAPALTARHDGFERSFAAGNDVVVGRDVHADMRVTHPLISRAHLLLRFDQGRWMAIDNDSLNGTFVNGQRVTQIDIQDGQSINIGNPDGPRLTFEIGRYQGTAGRPPQSTVRIEALPGAPSPSHPHPAQADPHPTRPAQQDRDGPPRRRGTPPADGQPSAGLRRQTAPAARHQQSRPRPKSSLRCSRNSN
jgi:ABC transport system ATP-binding/permease protein